MKFFKYGIIAGLFCLSFANTVKGQDVPVFKQFTDLERYIFKDNDTTYVINFWATWCKPCVKELPYFETLHQRTINQKIKIILVSLDFNKQLETQLKPFINKFKYSAEIVLLADKNYNQWLSKIDGDWSGSIPATLLVSGKRRLFAEKEFESTEDLQNWVQKFIHP